MKKAKLFLSISLIFSFYFLCLALDAYYLYLEYVIIEVLRELLTIPMILGLVLMLIVNSIEYQKNKYPLILYSILILSILIIFTFGTITYSIIT